MLIAKGQATSRGYSVTLIKDVGGLGKVSARRAVRCRQTGTRKQDEGAVVRTGEENDVVGGVN